MTQEDLSRLGRNYIETGKVLQEFADHGVRFIAINDGYEQEKAELETKAETLRNEIANRQDTLLNADRFRRLVDKYTDITELTPELVREFIQRLEIHERSGRHKKKHYTQQVDIYFNFIGQA